MTQSKQDKAIAIARKNKRVASREMDRINRNAMRRIEGEKHAEQSRFPIHKTLKDLKNTSGKMGGMKKNVDFIIHKGKVVRLSEKETDMARMKKKKMEKNASK